ncbi:MAG: acyltransferase [Candidatus Cloacimonadota bacterium]|nr:MAG: acyltransferase [Candidatus Cloacimonadota bacterium]
MKQNSLVIKIIRKIFRMNPDTPIRTGIINWVFQRVFGYNRHVPWMVHFTSIVGDVSKIKLGKAVYPGDSIGCYIQSVNGIEIGDYTNIGPGVGLISSNHDFYDNTKHIQGKPIKIGKKCWIGMNAIILPEVELGDFVIVGAGSVVTKSFPEGYCVIAGNPAKKIRELDIKKCHNNMENIR